MRNPGFGLKREGKASREPVERPSAPAADASKSGKARLGPLGKPSPESLPGWLSRQRVDLFVAWAVAALGSLAFANSLWNGFALDDAFIIVDNPAIRRLSNLHGIFAAGYWPKQNDLLYRPLIIFSYALNYALAGLAPFPYHLVNVLLHAGNCALVYLILMALFRARALALAAAAAFALHPIHTEAVASVVGRAELLANAFLFLSWRWYLRWDEGAARLKGRWLAASVAAFALAIFTKEHAVVLLGLLVLTDLLRASERGRPLGRTLWGRARSAYAWYLLPFVGYFVARVSVLGELLTSRVGFLVNPLAHTDPWTRVLTAFKVLGRYLWLLLVPVRLSSDYSYNQIPVSHSLLEPGVLAGLLALLGLCALAGWTWRRRPALNVGIAIFVLTILPVSNLPFPIGTIMAERVLYLPSLGFCLLLAGALMSLVSRPRWGPVALSAFALLLLGYGTRTVLRNQDWRNNATLYAAAALTSPNSAAAHYGLGKTMLEQGELSGARRELERSLKIYPEFGEAYHSLAAISVAQGQIDEAIRNLRIAIGFAPGYGLAHLNLGGLYLEKGMTAQALEEFRAAARLGDLRVEEINLLAKGFFTVGSLPEAKESLERALYYTPSSFVLRHNLGLVYSRQGRWEDAQRELEAAARLKPDSPEVQMNLGSVYAARGMPAQAEAAFKASLGPQGADPDVLSALAGVFIQQGRLAEAEETLQTAIRLRPDRAEAHYNLGVVFERRNELVDAQKQFEAAVRIKPQFPVARRALGAVLQQQGKMAEARREFKLAEDQEKLLRAGAPAGSGR
jgi:Tfp pilus assembly protein PilF